jgi:hypothetical protein
LPGTSAVIRGLLQSNLRVVRFNLSCNSEIRAAAQQVTSLELTETSLSLHTPYVVLHCDRSRSFTKGGHDIIRILNRRVPAGTGIGSHFVIILTKHYVALIANCPK